ncbi:MAG: tRNA dihydrouridine synthase DusB [Clostridia bacterium]|nr:tRNA dihydrouridine synthase DusB [Clostridia bacterium]
MGFKIGNTELKYGLMLAPMAGVTDKSFRAICRSFGAEYTVSEMVSAKALCYESRAKKQTASVTASLAYVSREELPFSVQLFGSESEFMAEAAKMIEELSYKGCRADCPPTAIDVNMGCPMRKITGNGEGSALMRQPMLAGKIIENMVKSISLPVTVKIRSGWDKDSVNAVEMAKVLEASGASLICVHARTREQLYSPGIDLGVIESVKKAVKIPVVGNGDIYSAADAMNMIEKTGCDGVMIGRGAEGNPWIFKEILSAMEGINYIPPTVEEKIELAKMQLHEMIADKGERVGLAEAKKHIAWYTAGVVGSAKARAEIMTATTKEEVETVLNALVI